MSHDFVVWEGAPPLSNVHGASEFERRRAQLTGGRSSEPPTAGIREFMTGLLAAYPDSDNSDSEDTPWLDRPLSQSASGSAMYLRVDERRVSSARKLIEVEASRLNLVAYDPQTMHLIPSATTMRRSSEFELPPAAELVLHLQAVIGEALEARHPMVGVLEERATGYYVQWLARDGAVMLEAEGDSGLPPGLWTDAPGRSTLHSLGFDEAEPNWQCLVENGMELLEPIAGVMAQILTVVRRIPAGAKMRIETFPLGQS